MSVLAQHACSLFACTTRSGSDRPSGEKTINPTAERSCITTKDERESDRYFAKCNKASFDWRAQDLRHSFS